MVSEGLQGTHMNALNPFNSKLMDIDPKGRFMNLFGDFSPLCAPRCCNCIATLVVRMEVN